MPPKLLTAEVGEELEAIDLIGAQGGVEAFREVRVDLELDVVGAVLDALPGLRIEDLGGLGIGELEGVHAVRLAGEVEGIEAEAGDGFALVGVELDFQAHPGAVVHADVATAGGDELADLGFGEIRALHVDDDAEVEPVDVLADDLEAHGGGDGIGEDGLEAEVDIELDVFGHRLDPFREFLGELLGDAGFEGKQLLVVAEAHFIEDGRDRIEILAGETEELLALDRLLLGEFPAFLGEALGAAALGLDGGDVDDQVLGLGGGEAGDELHFELRLELEIDDALLERLGQCGADFAEELDAFERVDDARRNQIARHDVGLLKPARRAGEDGFVGLIEFLAAGQQADGVGDVFPGGGDELECEALRIVGIVLTDPGERILGRL